MVKVYNKFLGNKVVVTSFGEVTFDAEGYAEIPNEEHANRLVGIGNFTIVDEDTKKAIEKAEKKIDEVKVPTVEENAKTDNKTVGEKPKFSTELIEKAKALGKDNKLADINAVADELGIVFKADDNTKAERLAVIEEFVAEL